MFSHSTNHSTVHSPIHSTTVSPLQGLGRSLSVIGHDVTSQACVSSHLFHPTAWLIQIVQCSPRQLVFTVHYCWCLYQIRTNETGSIINRTTLKEARRSQAKPGEARRSQAKPNSWLTLLATSSPAHFVSPCHSSFV